MSRYFTQDHEWIDVSGDVGTVGITDYAQGELGDVVFVELPQAGDHFDKMATFGTIEAVKAVSDLYCPVAGEVVEVNGALDGEPSLVNSDPYGDGWMIKLKVDNASDLSALMNAEAYEAHLEG